MKKYILVALAMVSLSVGATTVSVQVNPGTITNIITGPARVTSVVVTANSTNSFPVAIDTFTNLFNVATPAYTNVLTYATNNIVAWTNYFGVINTYTNLSLLDVSNVVASSTFTYPSVPFASPANTATTFSPINMQFYRGMWCTNPINSGIITMTVTYTQL